MPYIGVSEGEEREKGAENLFEERMVEHSLIWGKKQLFMPGVTESHKKDNPRRSTPRQIMIKMSERKIMRES